MSMTKLILATLLLGSTAYAQGDEAPHRPVDEAPGSQPAAAQKPKHHDPSKHFNFLGGPFEHVGKDEYGGKYGDGVMIDPKTGEPVLNDKNKPVAEEPMSAPFIWMLLNFGILLLILGKYGAPAARKLAQERHDQIKTALDEAAKLRKQAADKLSEYETRIKDVDAEVKKLMEGIRADAEADKKRILEAAQAQAVQMKKDSELRIAAEIELARAALTKEVSVAAANATEKLLRDKTTADDQNKLVATFISNVKSPTKEAR